MTFTVNTISRCPGGNHWSVDLTQGGQARHLEFQTSDLQLDFTNFQQVVDAVLNRLRSAAKEANAGTLAQVKTALEGKTFQI